MSEPARIEQLLSVPSAVTRLATAAHLRVQQRDQWRAVLCVTFLRERSGDFYGLVVHFSACHAIPQRAT